MKACCSPTTTPRCSHLRSDSSLRCTEPVLDCDGLFVDDGIGTTAQVLRAERIAARASLAAQQLVRHHVTGDAAQQRIAAEVEAIEVALTPLQRSRVFATALAGADIGRALSSEPGADRWQFVRHYVHHPDVGSAFFVLPESVVGAGMYFPHINACISPEPTGPLVIESDHTATTFTMGDGSSITVPRSLRSVPSDSVAGLRTLPLVDGVPVVNALVSMLPGAGELNALSPAEAASATSSFAAGVEMLAEVWPQAATAGNLFMDGALLLRRRDHARSHVIESTESVVALTVGSPVQIGDVLVHECAHLRLQAFERFDVLVEPSQDRYESPWRPDPRPIRGLVLGVHAFLDVAWWWRRLALSVPEFRTAGEQVFERQAHKIRAAWHTIESVATPTPLGSRVLDRLQTRVQSLC